MFGDGPGGGQEAPTDQTEGEEDDLEAEEDEFDPFANRHEDPPPEQEGDDRVHEGS